MKLCLKKGVGVTGIFLIIITAAFFFTMFYIVLDNVYQNMLPQLTNSPDTLNYFNTNLLPVWRFLPWLFVFSIPIYAIIQIQNPFSTGAYTFVWIIAVSYTHLTLPTTERV